MNSAVLFLTYRRFNTAEKVFSSIRQAQPPRLYFASNAPNPINLNEEGEVSKVRNLIELVDWPCELYTLFRDEHLSVKQSIPSAIDWFFEHEEMGIILEDDCLPDQSFYLYCDELLEKYKAEKNIMMISGNNFQRDTAYKDSYYFSKYTHIWGWATWRSRWIEYDVHMTDYPSLKKNHFLENYPYNGKLANAYWNGIFDNTYANNIKTWDYQWLFLCWRKKKISIVPSVNLVHNIGFGVESENTMLELGVSVLPSSFMRFPMKHPKGIHINEKSDLFVEKYHYKITVVWVFIRRLSSYFPTIKSVVKKTIKIIQGVN